MITGCDFAFSNVLKIYPDVRERSKKNGSKLLIKKIAMPLQTYTVKLR